MSTAQFTIPLITVIPGQLITASGWNGEFDSLFTNLNPLGIGAYSDTDSQMQTSTDPFPSGTSRPTSMGGELERIRYILNLIIGQTYWYQHPETNLHDLLSSPIPAGTVMVFYQAAAPTGWTQVVTDNDKALRVVSGAGGGTGGTNAMSTGLSHSHTVNSHTHDLANHTHTMGNHTHTSAAHTHTVSRDGWGDTTGSTTSGRLAVTKGGATIIVGDTIHMSANDQTSGSTTPGVTGAPSSNTSDGPSTNTSGAATPGTDTQAPTFQYIDIILCSKD